MRNHQKNFTWHTVLALLGILIGLESCSSGKNDADLQQYVHQVLVRSGQPIPPLPVLKNQDGFVYARQNMRSPFKPFSLNAGLMPDFKRPKEELEAFALDSLHMVGVINRNGTTWAIIRAPDDTVHYISLGGHLGQNFGKVTVIDSDGIKVTELSANGNGGWEKHDTSMNLEVPIDQTSG